MPVRLAGARSSPDRVEIAYTMLGDEPDAGHNLGHTRVCPRARVRPASLCSLARERCVVRALLIFEVRAVRQSSDCVLWRMVPLGATLLSTHSAAATAGGTASGMAEIGRVKLQFAAARHGTAPLGTILDSTPFSLRVSTDTLRCCFSAAVCVYAMCRAFGPAQKLPPAVAEASAKSSACGRGALGF
jgi:hypothetical protein